MRKSLRPTTGLRSLAALGVAALAAASLTACGSSEPSDPGSATSGTVSWWGWTPTDTATAEAYISAFNEEYPDITVDYKLVAIADWQAALRPALSSDSGPDVFDMQPGSYVDQFKSFAEDLTPLAEDALGDDWESKVAPIGVSGLTDETGKLTAMSVGSTYAGLLWINKGIFDEHGLTPPTTMEEWVKVCDDLRAAGEGCFVQGAAQQGFDQDTLQSIANSVEPGLWEAVTGGEKKWTEPGIVETLSIWKQLFDDGIMQPGAIGYQQYPDANNDFLTGKYAMVQMGTWYTQYATESGITAALSAAGVAGAQPFPILPLPFPDVAGNGNEAHLFGDADYGLAISKKAKNKAAAETFVKWMTTTTEGQTVVANQLQGLPALQSVQPDYAAIGLVDPALQTQPVQDVLEQVSSVDEPRFALISADVSEAILAAATSVATGSATPEDAAEALQTAAVAAGDQQ